MPRKHGRDRGLYEHPKDSGVWWILYYDSNHHEHSEKGGNKSEARALLEQRKTEVRLGTWKPSPKANRGRWRDLLDNRLADETTLGEFALRWLDERTPHLTRQVQYNYRVLLSKHLLPNSLARMPLNQIDDGDIATFVKELRTVSPSGSKALSAGRVNDVLKRLTSIFSVAHRRKLIDVDPMEYVERLRESKPEIDPMSLDEALRIMDAARAWERAFMAVLLFTGMRPGEALALPWPNIDFEHGLIRVRRTLTRRFGFGLPKTPGSERDVEMCEIVRTELTEQRARSQLRSELVFPSEAGTPIDLQNFRERNWPRILRRAKVRPRVLYQCRHTFVRLALEYGDHPQHIAAMLGHVSTEMIFKRYGRWMERPQSAAMAKLDAAIASRLGPGFGPDSTLETAAKE
jgi:integrase